jgi:hypothetical protein
MALEAVSLPTWVASNAKIQETDGRWVHMDLWDDQVLTLEEMQATDWLLVLKARQLGLTWMCVDELVWMMLTRPGLQAGVYSLREEEAIAVVQRVKDVYARVRPEWYHGPAAIDNNNHWRMANGSAVRAFSSTSGDSYTFGYVLVDEADLIPDLGGVLRRAEPTIADGGKMRLVSRSNKTAPASLFKAMYRAARDGRSKWRSIFLPWWARPTRTVEWYDEQRRTTHAATGNLDFVYEQYPENPDEALAPAESDKRFPMSWVEACLEVRAPLAGPTLPTLPGLKVWSMPQADVRYYLGGDPAEGNPTSDPSTAQVIDSDGHQVARLAGRFDPTVFASHVRKLAKWYNEASVLIERNNHGHAVHVALTEIPDLAGANLVMGRDSKLGWLSNVTGNVALYDNLADSLRDRRLVIRDRETADQLQTILGADLSAPEGLNDDLADALGLADMCRTLSPMFGNPVSAANPSRPVTQAPTHRTEPTRPPHWDK